MFIKIYDMLLHVIYIPVSTFGTNSESIWDTKLGYTFHQLALIIKTSSFIDQTINMY